MLCITRRTDRGPAQQKIKLIVREPCTFEIYLTHAQWMLATIGIEAPKDVVEVVRGDLVKHSNSGGQ